MNSYCAVLFKVRIHKLNGMTLFFDNLFINNNVYTLMLIEINELMMTTDHKFISLILESLNISTCNNNSR